MLYGLRLAFLLLALGISSPIRAVSIYDVIELSGKGYSDADLVQIINNTGSVFELKVEDIPLLKNLGVSEVVIRAMLTPPPTAEGTTDAPGATDATDAEDVYPATSANAASRFAVRLIDEEVGNDHQHAYVTLSTVPVLILRDEGAFSTVEKRGEALASSLELASRTGKGYFQVVRLNSTNRVVYRGAGFEDIPIAAINSHDIQAYDVRSEIRVTSELLAGYWAALLNDYWAIAVLRSFPDRLVGLHRGDVFKLLFNLMNNSGNDESIDLEAAVQQLPGSIQRHLQRLSQSVPEDFGEVEEYAGGAS